MRSILLATAAVALTMTAAQAQPATQALRTADFLNSVGVNLHLNSQWDTSYSDAANGGTGAGSGVTTVNGYTTNVSKIAAALNYAGLTRVRVGMSAPYVLSRFQALALASPWLRADVQVDTGPAISDQLARAAQVPDRIDSFEGMNEGTDRTDYYNGQNAAPADCAFQRDLRVGVTAWNKTYQPARFVPLLAPSVADWNGFGQLAGCASSSDASNGHSYVDATPPTASKAYDLPHEQQDAPAGAPNYVTETGPITNALTSRGMSEDYAARRTLDLLLAFKKTTVRTYLYELVDERAHNPVLNDGSSDEQEMHYGLFHSDWTAKASAVALHNQAAILLDHAATAGTFAPGSLAYAISGAAPATYSLLMQKADGTFILALWAEPNTWNAATSNSAGWASTPTPTTVTVSFPAMSAIGASDAFGMAATLPAGTNAKVVITDHPVYLSLTVAPPVPVTPPTPVTPPPVTPPPVTPPAPVATSANGTTITGATGSIGDAHGDAFTLVAAPGLGNQIAMNGKVDGATSSVVTLEWLNGNLFQVNTAGNGWVKVAGAGAWTAVSADVVGLCLKH